MTKGVFLTNIKLSDVGIGELMWLKSKTIGLPAPAAGGLSLEQLLDEQHIGVYFCPEQGDKEIDIDLLPFNWLEGVKAESDVDALVKFQAEMKEINERDG